MVTEKSLPDRRSGYACEVTNPDLEGRRADQSEQGDKEKNVRYPARADRGADFFLRGQKVTLSTHLAELYGVEPRALP